MQSWTTLPTSCQLSGLQQNFVRNVMPNASNSNFVQFSDVSAHISTLTPMLKSNFAKKFGIVASSKKAPLGPLIEQWFKTQLQVD